MTECDEHKAHSVRLDRTESDVQKLFDKLGGALGLMYKIDKRLEGLYGKIAGIALASSFLMGVIIVLVQKVMH
jgi:hypothetical protein